MYRPLFTICLVLLSARLAVSEPLDTPDPSEVALSDELARLVEQLDSGRFDVRRQAMNAMLALTARPELKPRLAVAFERLLVRSDLSFEVRRQIEVLRRNLPQASVAPVEDVMPEEIVRLVADLEDESYSVRLGASKRLKWLLDTPRWGLPVMRVLKPRLDDDGLSVDLLRWIEPIYAQARGAWTFSGASEEGLFLLTRAQIQPSIDALVESPSDPPTTKDSRRVKRAERKLSDALALDADVPFIQEAIKARLDAGGLDANATQRLTKLLEQTQQAMVAEFWESRRNLGVQRLIVGVPSQSPGAIRPSHFDAIDDSTAHCVSGVNLSEGDYPVGVAISHPNRTGALFHLVNLSTPRRRMAYDYSLKKAETVRLRDLTQRTTARLLRRKQPLTENEIMMLGSLDAVEVSRFAGEFFLAVEDSQFTRIDQPGVPSRHGRLCELLITDGTKEAIPGLEKAIETGRFLPLPHTGSNELPWIAALTIAKRDSWPEVDAWLAERIGRKDPLVKGLADSPELGATAAAILLSRHHRLPVEMGLERITKPFSTNIQLVGYRYSDTKTVETIKQWWNETRPMPETSL